MPIVQGVDSTGAPTAVAVDESLANAAGAAPMAVSLTGGAVGGSTVAQGDPNAGGADAWPVTDVDAQAKLDDILAATKQLAGFETLTAISYGGGDQTSITDGSNGIWINTGGDLKVDTWAGATAVTFTVIVGLFPLRRVKKIYQTGSSAAGYIGYPPS